MSVEERWQNARLAVRQVENFPGGKRQTTAKFLLFRLSRRYYRALAGREGLVTNAAASATFFITFARLVIVKSACRTPRVRGEG